MEAALALAPRPLPVLSAAAAGAPVQRLSLREFITVAHEMLDLQPLEALEELCGEDGDEYSTELAEVLCRSGWRTIDFGGLVLSNATGMVFAHLSGFLSGGTSWRGLFSYASPFPSRKKARRDAIKKRDPLIDGYRIEMYERCMPGLEVCTIDVRRMQMTFWCSDDADRNSEDFKLWVRIFECLLDRLDLSIGRGNKAQEFFDKAFDPYWQWTRADCKDIEQFLRLIGDSSRSETEVIQRVRKELGYPFDNIVVKEHAPLGDSHRGYFVAIKSPIGHDMNLTSRCDG